MSDALHVSLNSMKSKNKDLIQPIGSHLPNDLLHDMRSSEQAEFIRASMECMALNNSITITDTDSQGKGGQSFFSRDQISCALLRTVERYNYKLIKKTDTEIILQIEGEVELYEIVGILSFSNT